MFYEYECGNCGKFVIRRSILADPLKECPKCGEPISQLFTTPPAIRWVGRFRWMKGEPEVDMEKIEAEQNAQALKQAKAKVHTALGEKTKKYY